MDTYEKKYKESLELARDYYKANLKLDKADENFILEDIFPELKESEDEKIRKAMIKGLSSCASKYWGGFEIKAAIAWLEKQGEKKPFDYENANIKQKDFAPKIEPFDKYEGLTDFERTLADICIGWIGQELGWKQYIKDNADVLLKIAIKMFNSVQDAPFEQKPTDNDMVEELRTEYEKGKADAFAEMQKEWSEEDENHVISLLERLEGLCRNEFERTRFAINEDQDWLKSLKDRYTWKPSEEQMITLRQIISGCSYDFEPLVELEEQLKKLYKL